MQAKVHFPAMPTPHPSPAVSPLKAQPEPPLSNSTEVKVEPSPAPHATDAEALEVKSEPVESQELSQEKEEAMDVEVPIKHEDVGTSEPRIMNYLSKEENNRILNVVESNADLLCRKLASLVPDVCPDHPVSHTVPINNRVAMLLDAAVDPANMACIAPYYLPWF
jgi:hypothetical protein